MSWFDDQGLTGEPIKTDPASIEGGAQFNQAAPPKAGTSWLDWIAQTYGTSKARGGGFADLPGGTSVEQAIQRFNQETGSNARYIGGASGDQVDFGQGATDVLTAGGQLWQNPYGLGSGPAAPAGGGAPGGGAPAAPAAAPVVLPAAPTLQTLATPEAFSYGQGVPTAPNLTYNAMATPEALEYQRLATPDAFQNMTADELQQDPSYQFRLQQGQQALEQSAAAKGLLRTGGTYKGLLDYGQNAASQEYAAANARKLGAYQTNAQTGLSYGQANNQNALNFGQANFNNQFSVNQANNQGNFNVGNANFQNQLASQNQGYNQAAGAYGLNANTGLAYGQANNQNALASYQAQVNAALGQGNLNLGYQNSANSYALGQGNLALGQGQLGMAQQGQAFNQGLALNTNAWNQNYALANLGNPGAPNSQGYGGEMANIYGQQGNANAAGQVGSANAWNQGLTNLANLGVQAGAYATDPYYRRGGVTMAGGAGSGGFMNN